ncbi:MAG TPA: hypothetical protein VE959_38265 [Bryobacteraceae bacterium]|nr:hypothetical protein [Bryobacteraceae bacterium]
MKLATLALATVAAAAVGMTGCDSPSLLSLDPFVTRDAAVFDAGLLGTWTEGAKDDSDLCIIRPGADAGYRITYVGGAAAQQYDALMFSVGDARILDLSPANSDDFSIAGHVPVRVWIEGSQLRWSYLDSEWLREQAGRQLAVRSLEKRMLLSAPGAATRSFLTKYAADEKAHGGIATWQRLP